MRFRIGYLGYCNSTRLSEAFIQKLFQGSLSAIRVLQSPAPQSNFACEGSDLFSTVPCDEAGGCLVLMSFHSKKEKKKGR